MIVKPVYVGNVTGQLGRKADARAISKFLFHGAEVLAVELLVFFG